MLASLWGALAPLRMSSREYLFAFPAAALRSDRTAQPVLTLARELRLTLGVQDVLLLHNLDRTAHVVGPLHLLPGQAFRWPFEAAGVYRLTCPDIPGGSLTIRVVELPDPGWGRLRWRLNTFSQALRTLPLVAPPV